jgi:hypothetical protein
MGKIGEEDEHDIWLPLSMRVACNPDRGYFFSGAINR